MAFYEQHGRQQSWDQSQVPPSSSTGPVDGRWSGRGSEAGASPAPQREEGAAFSIQFEEIERAHDNLAKGGRGFSAHGRRDSLPMQERGSGPHRHSQVAGSEFEGTRASSSHSSSSYQGYLANQRFGPRQSEAEQMLQFKRRAAAQRERDLRNYHQEQQFNRNQSGPKSDRSMSPSAMNEEDRRDLIARQHRALYGEGSTLYMGESPSGRPVSQDARVLASGTPGDSYESFASPPPASSSETAAPLSTPAVPDERSRKNSISSKSPGPNAFAMFDANQQTKRTSSSSPGGSPTRQPNSAQPGGAVAPIGTRPVQAATGQPNRATPPMSSPLNPGYNFANTEKPTGNPAERASSAQSNPASKNSDKQTSSLAWNGNGGPWGSSKTSLGAQTSVWG